ncbi:MAG: hypothetical protein HOE90_13195 [Bacteriovoracaceae bacterium]|jgi:hypothetical protein|nr:hypothetical protein [Bacteriovoracaceae bacterium]
MRPLNAPCVFLLLLSTTTLHAVVNKIDIRVEPSEFRSHLQIEDKFEFSWAKASVNGQPEAAAELSTRGNSCLGAPRRCFKIKFAEDIRLKISETKFWEVKNFNLTSMWQDNGYINHKIGMGLAKKLKLLSLKNTYVLLTVNKKPYGLYIALQKPTKNLKTSPYVARRREEGEADTKKYRSKIAGSYSEADFITAYESMYERIQNRNDETLYGFLKERLNIENYFKLLALHTLLRNGDYTDELFFYARPLEQTQGKIYFDILPWDFEDLFSSPHDGKPNKKAGKKGYFKKTILYSFEDPLDMAIARNSSLYRKFLARAKNTLEIELTDEVIDQVIKKVHSKITPYLDFPGVYSASKRDEIHDDQVYSKGYILNLLEKRKSELKSRRKLLLRKI